MASITIRNFDDELKQLLRVRAAGNGHSMEQEARDILRTALEKPPTPPKNLETITHKGFNKHGEVELELQPSKGLGTEIHELFKPLGGVDLELLPQEPMPEPPKNLAEAIRARFAKYGGVELELPSREPMREPPQFD